MLTLSEHQVTHSSDIRLKHLRYRDLSLADASDQLAPSWRFDLFWFRIFLIGAVLCIDHRPPQLKSSYQSMSILLRIPEPDRVDFQ